MSTVKNPNHSPWQNAEGMPKPLQMQYTKISTEFLAVVFLLTHCQGKLKNFEFALAFYCQCT